MGHRACRYLCICLLVLLGTAHLWADVTGSIQGYVRDSSGAVISGAHVVVTEIATNVSREASTDSQGSYTFLALPPGRYKIIATMTGFQQSTVNNVDLSVNDKLAFDLTLPVGSVQQNVSVEANALQVQTVGHVDRHHDRVSPDSGHAPQRPFVSRSAYPPGGRFSCEYEQRI